MTCAVYAQSQQLFYPLAYILRGVVVYAYCVDRTLPYICRLAYCGIMTLPDGYQTKIGEGGSSLSGGEKQRIFIARAILKDAPIVVLDEATASADPENEQELQKAIRELTKGKTILMIAHRLSTVRTADQIIVLENGRIIQRGKVDCHIQGESAQKAQKNRRASA